MTYSHNQTLSRPKSRWTPIVVAIGAALALTVSISAQTFAAPESASPLMCFSGTTDGGYNGTCTLSGNTAVVNTVDGDVDPNNAYGGVYYEQTNLSGKLISQVDKLAFSYDGTGASGGSPRFSVPIDENNDGVYDGFAFVDSLGCNDGDANVGTVDVVNDPTCTIQYGSDTFPNWAAFVAAHPTYRISTDTIPFVIVDQPGQFTLSNVQIGSQTMSVKDQCKNGGWKTMTDANGNTYKNQGQCVATATSHPKSKLNH